MHGAQYIATVTQTVERAWREQAESLQAAAAAIAQTVKAKHNVFVFGCSHAGIVAEEVFYRTGGLAVINPIFFPAMMLNTRPITMTSALERVSGVGQIILEQNRLQAGDLLILHSVSGRNAVPVDMALWAAGHGVATVCLTNLAYSAAITARHPSGKRLFEVCDIVIDNKGAVGDAAVSLPGLPEKIGPTSTVVGAALINAIVIDAVEQLLADGLVPPVLMSANLDGGDAHNARIFEEYRDNIFYM